MSTVHLELHHSGKGMLTGNLLDDKHSQSTHAVLVIHVTAAGGGEPTCWIALPGFSKTAVCILLHSLKGAPQAKAHQR